MAETLLPRESASAMDIAISEAVAEWWDVDPSVITTVWDPWRVPAHVLPYLANALNLPVWNDNWPIERQRSVVASAIPASRLVGSEEGYRIAVDWADAELIKATFPPAKFFLGKSLTPDQRDNFVRRYPELRVYPFRSGGKANFGWFMGHAYLSRTDQPSGSRVRTFLRKSDAAARFGKQAYLYKEGTETWLKTVTRTVEQVEGTYAEEVEVRRPSKAVGWFIGQPLPAFLHDHKAASRLYRMRLNRRYSAPVTRLRYQTIKPGLDTLGYDTEPVALKGKRGRVAFLGHWFIGQPMVVSDANMRLFDRTWLFDPEVAVLGRNASTFMGDGRLGMKKFTAELRIKMRGRAVPRAQTRFLVGGFVGRRKPNRLADLRRAVRWASLGRDKVLITTKTVEPVVAGDVLAGEVVAGALKDVK